MFTTLFEILSSITEAVPGDHSEVFMFMNRRFEIGDAWKLINHDPSRFETATLKLNDLKSLMGLIGIDKEHAKNISPERLNQPGIVIRLPDNEHMLIDGWHIQHPPLHSQESAPEALS